MFNLTFSLFYVKRSGGAVVWFAASKGNFEVVDSNLAQCVSSVSSKAKV